MVTTSDLSSTKPAYGLKRLGFVRDYSGYYWTKSSGLASHLYTSGKQYAPASLQPRIKTVEDKVSEYSHPAFVTIQDKSDSVLHVLDAKVCADRSKPHAAASSLRPLLFPVRSGRWSSNLMTPSFAFQVDYAAGIASRYYSSAGNELSGQVQRQKDYHRENLERYKAAREAYLQKIEDTVGFVKQHGITGAAKYSADAVLAQVEEAKKIPAFLEKQGSVLASKVQEAWHKFYSLPAGAPSSFSWHRVLVIMSFPVSHPAGAAWGVLPLSFWPVIGWSIAEVGEGS